MQYHFFQKDYMEFSSFEHMWYISQHPPEKRFTLFCAPQKFASPALVPLSKPLSNKSTLPQLLHIVQLTHQVKKFRISKLTSPNRSTSRSSANPTSTSPPGTSRLTSPQRPVFVDSPPVTRPLRRVSRRYVLSIAEFAILVAAPVAASRQLAPIYHHISPHFAELAA